MMRAMAICRKLRGATPLFVLWLSLIATIQGVCAQTDSRLAAPAPVALTQILGSQEVVCAEERLSLADEFGQGSDDSGDPPFLSLFPILFQVLAGTQLHRLPPATGPPGSSSTHHFQARAPPFV